MTEYTFLRKVPLFAEFDEAELRRLDDVLVETTFEPGELILGEGQPNRALHIVRDGRVRVSRAAEEGDVILSDLPAGRTFGELSILDEGTARAVLELAGASRVSNPTPVAAARHREGRG